MTDWNPKNWKPTTQKDLIERLHAAAVNAIGDDPADEEQLANVIYTLMVETARAAVLLKSVGFDHESFARMAGDVFEKIPVAFPEETLLQ